MSFIADMLLIAGAVAAGFYCYVLSRRLRRFTDLEKGVGGAVAVLSVQVDDLARSLQSAQSAASGSVATLTEVSDRADAAARRLELLVASLHDLPAPATHSLYATATQQGGSNDRAAQTKTQQHPSHHWWIADYFSNLSHAGRHRPSHGRSRGINL
jgi:hypothetical protein